MPKTSSRSYKPCPFRPMNLFTGRMTFCHFHPKCGTYSGENPPWKISSDSRAFKDIRKESRFPFRLPFRFPPPRAMRKELPDASSLQTFSFLSATPFRHGFSRKIEIYRVLKALPSVAGRAFPAQNIDNSPPLCARRKISFSQTIFHSAEIKNRKCAIGAKKWRLCEKHVYFI